MEDKLIGALELFSKEKRLGNKEVDIWFLRFLVYSMTFILRKSPQIVDHPVVY